MSISFPQSVAYIYSDSLIKQCDILPTMLNRASIVHNLIESYGLIDKDNLSLVLSQEATEDELKLFHSTSYIEFLKKVNNMLDFDEVYDEQDEYGLGYDCPILPHNYDFIKTIAGGSLTGAKLLNQKLYRIVVNWFGGWHHAQRDEAEGFCYVNDVVIAIQELTKTFNKILYLDLDVHHGNGVQNAFEYSNKILTLSFHEFSPGFYPGSGSIDEVGSKNGKYYTINVPFVNMISDKNYIKLFDAIFPKIVECFKPECLVVQCGADGLYGDPIGKNNLTLYSYGHCIKRVLQCNLPTLYLGGGGYNFPNTARLWAYLTSLILKTELEDDIPDDCQYFTKFGPTFELHLDPSFQKDKNEGSYIDTVIDKILSYCEYIV